MSTDITLKIFDFFKREKALLIGVITAILFILYDDFFLSRLANSLYFSMLFVWLFITMLWMAFSVVRHADGLAVILGEPYGTLILTISVISIEVVMISAVMLTGGNNPTLARDTLFSVLMIVLNGMVGLTLLLGALKYKEQIYNLKGASAYLAVIIPLAGLGLILPRYTTSAPGGEVSPMMGVYLIIMSLTLYGVFLAIQTLRHRSFFQQPLFPEQENNAKHEDHHFVIGIRYHALMLPITMLPIILLSKKMAVMVDHGISTMGAPQALGGFLVAILVLSPEAMAAVKSALDNKLQRTMNITLGSALSTIGMTIPAILTISLVTGKPIELGLEQAEAFLLIFTLMLAIVNFNSERTNILYGVVHLVLFMTYIMLIFD